MISEQKKEVYFVVSHDDAETITLINEECSKVLIEPQIVYFGFIEFRGAKFPVLSESREIYDHPIEQGGIMRGVLKTSCIIQMRVMISTLPLVGCISKSIKQVMTDEFLQRSSWFRRTLIIHDNGENFLPWFHTCYKRFLSVNPLIKVSPCVKQIIHELNAVPV